MTEPAIVIGIIRNTPIWVWPVMAGLFFVGIRRTQPRVVSLRRMLVFPVLIFLLTASSAFQHSANGLDLVAFGLMLVAGLGLGNRIGQACRPEPGSAPGTIRLPGEWWSLTLLMSAFLVHYGFGVLDGIAPSVAHTGNALVARAVLMGLFGGMFLGRALTIVRASTRNGIVRAVLMRD